VRLAAVVAAAAVGLCAAVSHAAEPLRYRASPAWSPDGKHIAWAAGRPWSVWVANPDGSHARRLPGLYEEGVDQLEWADPSTMVVEGGFTLYRVRLPSGTRTRLTRVGGTFSLAAGRVAVGTLDCPGCVGPFTITDVKTAKTIEVGDPKTFNGDPSLSPDGRWVALDGLKVEPWDGSKPPRALVSGAACPEWSPNGRTILYRDNTTADLHVVPASGGSPSGPLLKDEGYGCSARWAPDSVRITFSDGDRTHIFDTHTHALRDFPAKIGVVAALPGSPAVGWSHDGKQLLVLARKTLTATCDSLWRLDAATLAGKIVSSGCP
jgi:WD40-like Beta Propeller Repeat